MKRYLVIVAGLLAMIFQVGCSNDWVRTQYEDYRKRTAELDTETIVAALKQALEQGTHRGVSALGTVDGYWKNAKLRIPVPDNLAKVEKFVRKIGADKYADRFILSLNRAAEAAVPHAKAIYRT